MVGLGLKAETFLLAVEKSCSGDFGYRDPKSCLCLSVSWGCSSVHKFQDKNLVIKSLDRP